MKKALLYAAVLALSTSVYAADDEETTQMSSTHVEFVKLDTNHDGKISAEEAKADPALDAVFDEVSTDGSVDEYSYTDWKRSDSE